MSLAVFAELPVIGCIAVMLRREAISPGPRPEGVRGFPGRAAGRCC